MRKYLITVVAVILALNSQTFLFAAGSKGFTNSLSDTSFITLKRLLKSPDQGIYNALAKDLSDINLAPIAPGDFYKIYTNVLANPSASTDFDLTQAQLKEVIKKYENSIITSLRNTYAFQIEKRQNPNLTLSDFINNLVNKNINLLGQYYKANPNVTLYDINKEKSMSVNIQANKEWPNAAYHQELLIKAAALRVIAANLSKAKAGITYDLALFDIISVSRTSKTEINVHFNNGALSFALPKEAYKYVPFGTLKLVERDTKFMTALQEVEKKKQNPNYNFSIKRDRRGRDYIPPEPSVYDSPFGAGSVR